MNNQYLACNTCLKTLSYITRNIYFKRWGIQTYAILVINETRKDRPRQSFVMIQATLHRLFWVGSWSFVKEYNNVPSLHMYRLIIKAAKPAIFTKFAHICVLVPNMYNMGIRCVYFVHNQGLKTLPRVIL